MDPNFTCDVTNVENFTQTETADANLYTDFMAVMVVVIMPSILIFGLTSNLSFLLVVHRVRHMRTVTNYLLLQLALTDIVNLIVSIGERIWRYISSPIINDKSAEGQVPGCILLPFVKAVSHFASLFFMTLVTLEMYFAICKPIKHRAMTVRALTIKLTCACWGVAFLAACLRIPSHCVLKQSCIVWPSSAEYHDLPIVVRSCRSFFEWIEDASNAVQTIPFFVGMAGNAVLYVRIMKALRTRITPSDRPFQVPTRARNRVAHMLVINYWVWFFLVLPFECLSFVVAFYPVRSTTVLDIAFSFRALNYLNSAVNPLIFYTVHPRYRKAFLKTCSQCLGHCRGDAKN